SRRLDRPDRPSCKCAAEGRNFSAPLAPPVPPSRLRRAVQTAERVSTLRDCRPSATSSTELDCFSVFQAFDASATRDSFATSKPDDWRGFKKHSAKVGKAGKNGKSAAKQNTVARTPWARTPWVRTQWARTISLLDQSDFHVLRRGILLQQIGHSL